MASILLIKDDTVYDEKVLSYLFAKINGQWLCTYPYLTMLRWQLVISVLEP